MSAAAAAAAVLSLAYALSIALPSLWPVPAETATPSGGFGAALSRATVERGLNASSSWLLFAYGLTLSLASVSIAEDRPASGLWLRWGLGLGLIGAAFTAANGLYDAISVPILVEQWATQDAGRRAAISAMSGLPSMVDPRGLGSLLFAGLFVATQAAARPAGTPLRWAGTAHAATAILAFVAAVALGTTLLPRAYPLLAGLAFGVTGPVWWALAARELARPREASSPS
jgi:hypothetical protein